MYKASGTACAVEQVREPPAGVAVCIAAVGNLPFKIPGKISPRPKHEILGARHSVYHAASS